MEIASRIQDGTLVITINGEVIDAAGAPDFRSALLSAIEDAHIYSVIIDLSQVRFIDSSGLGVFLATLRHLDENGGELKMAGMSTSVHAMFQIVRMHKLFEIYATVESALAQQQQI